jgi:hypothetical protein
MDAFNNDAHIRGMSEGIEGGKPEITVDSDQANDAE